MLLTSYVGKCSKKRHLMKSRGEGQTFGGIVRARTGRNEGQHQIKWGGWDSEANSLGENLLEEARRLMWPMCVSKARLGAWVEGTVRGNHATTLVFQGLRPEKEQWHWVHFQSVFLARIEAVGAVSGNCVNVSISQKQGGINRNEIESNYRWFLTTEGIDVSGNDDSNILALNDHRIELPLTERKRLSVVSSGTDQVWGSH